MLFFANMPFDSGVTNDSGDKMLWVLSDNLTSNNYPKWLADIGLQTTVVIVFVHHKQE